MAKEVLQRLLRSPRKIRKADLLSDREYNELSTTTFEEFLQSNLNSEQLRKLTTDEEKQLETFYLLREKRAARTWKLMRDKPQRSVVPPVVARYVPARDEPPEVVDQEVNTRVEAPQDSTQIRALVDDIEKRITDESALPEEPELAQSVIQPVILEQQEQMETSAPAKEIERALENENASLDQIDLSQAMPPRELLIEEPPAQIVPVPVGIVEEELDLGPPGDAAAFFGVDYPMPVTDPAVMDLLRQEFPSLGRPPSAGRFEELDVMPQLAAEELMPPPAAVGGGISASTPIVQNPTIRRFYNTNLSAIKPPTLAREAQHDEEQELQVVPKEKPTSRDPPQNTQIQDTLPPVEAIAENVAFERMPVNEPIQVTESHPAEQPEVAASAISKSPSVPVPELIESSSSEEQPVQRIPRVRKTIRKVPTFGDTSIPVTMQLRTVFNMDADDNLELFEPTRTLIQGIIDIRTDRVVPQARTSTERPSLPAGIEEHLVMRDISTTQAELSSIRGPPTNQSKLYPIQEQPQHEKDEEQPGLQGVSAPVAEATLPPAIEPALPPVPTLTEVPLGQPNQSLDTGLGNQMLFPDSSVNFSVPQVVITDTSASFDTGVGVNRDSPSIVTKPPFERSGVQIGTDKPRPEPIQEVPTGNEAVQQQVAPRIGNQETENQSEKDQSTTSSNETLTSILKFYLTLQREVGRTKRNAITMERIEQITGAEKLACARRFQQLLTLKKWGFIELEAGESGHLCKIFLRRF